MPPLHVAVTADDVTSETSVWGIWPTKGLDLFRMQKVGKMLNCVLSLWQQYPGRHRWMIHTIYWTCLYALCFTSRRQSQDTRYDECYCLEPCRVAAWKGRCCRFLLVIGNNWNKFRRISVETQDDILTVRLSSTATVTVRRRSWFKPSCHIWQWPVEGHDHDPPSDLDTCIALLSIRIQILTVKGPIL